MKNAIILAAGKSSRFAPFTYEKPKGLFCVKVIMSYPINIIWIGYEKCFVWSENNERY